MKNFLSRHPYAVTSAIFLVLLFFGFYHLNWRREYYMFMLLLYFIITLGIRLDDISHRLGSGREKPPEPDANILSTLQEIQLSLKETNHQLQQIRNTLDQDPNT